MTHDELHDTSVAKNVRPPDGEPRDHEAEWRLDPMSERRALIVGIDSYKYAQPLNGGVADARSIAEALRAHADGTPNFGCSVLLGTAEVPVTRVLFRKACQALFEGFKGDAVLFFSGHGVLSDTGGVLATFEGETGDWGIPMSEVITRANRSSARNVLLMLDCCHSGDLANEGSYGQNALASLRDDVTVIAASRDVEVALEHGGRGIFTQALLDALDGAAADPLGLVTAPALYMTVERRFGAWDQRPVYKSHATRAFVVRQCAAIVERLKLRKLVELFPSAEGSLQLSPEYEPQDEHGNVREPVDHGKVALAQLFKDYRDAGLLRPTFADEQLYWTARRSHCVELTTRGREYWRLVKRGMI